MIDHTMRVGNILYILFLYQFEKEILFESLSVRVNPDAKKKRAFPCAPKVASAGFIFLYSSPKCEFVINSTAINFIKSIA